MHKTPGTSFLFERVHARRERLFGAQTRAWPHTTKDHRLVLRHTGPVHRLRQRKGRQERHKHIWSGIHDMPTRYHAQRQHIVRCLDQIVYQLCTISFFLSPSLLPFLFRVLFQLQFTKSRELDPERSLRFWFCLVVVFNAISVWSHATNPPAQVAERSIMLDFVGPGATPSRLYLLALDFAIIIFDMLLVAVAYETSLYETSPKDAPDPLLPIPPASPEISRPPSPDFSSPSASTAHLPREYRYPPKPPSATEQQASYVIDLRLSTIYRRLRDPAPPVPERQQREELLPLPITTPLPLPGTLRMLLRARTRVQREQQRAQQREERRQRNQRQAEEDERRNDEDETSRARTVPGGLDVEGEGG